MDLNIDKSFCTDDDIEKIEPGEVWEDCWFFGNLLDRKTRMLRSLSDPCTSSKSFNLPEKSYEETYESIKKLPVRKQASNLIRASSMSPSVERKDETPTSKVRNKSNKKKTSSNKLLRAPSLPTSLGTEDEEIEFSMGKLIRQASLNNSNILPPRNHASKSVTPSSSITKQRSRRKQELESIQFETQKSFNDLDQYEKELKGFKDLGFGVDDKKDLSTNAAINAIPGWQENKRIEEYDEEEKMKGRPYFSSSSAPPVPKWGGKKSREDMKAQIKFWARAVASNVRQEC